MDTELLQKYISGHATEEEKRYVTEWIKQSNDNMREYMAQRKLHNIALWRMESMAEEKEKMQKSFTWHTLWMETAKIAAVFAIVLLGANYWSGKQQTDVKEPLQTIYVPAGQRAEIMLADGTKVWLNSRSSMTFPGSFKGNVRNVKLDGEGYFAVAGNVEKPFIVETNKCDVKVLGTEFNVTAYTADSIWETALLKGAVEIRISGTTKTMKLEPNTMASMKDSQLMKEDIKDADYFLWREGLICFNDISVGQMIKKLELYYGVDIMVNNTKILTNRYTGKFRTKDGVEHVLKVLKLNNKFTYTKDDENNIITIN